MFDKEMTSNVAIGVGVGIVIGWFLRGRSRLFYSLASKSGKGFLQETEKNGASVCDSGEYKMVIVVRMDLKMGKGKIAAQCCHATASAIEKLGRYDPDLLKTWRSWGQPKVVVKTDNEASLLELSEIARTEGLMASMICDAGRTQIAAGSKTVLAVGPGKAGAVDRITGHLKLL